MERAAVDDSFFDGSIPVKLDKTSQFDSVAVEEPGVFKMPSPQLSVSPSKGKTMREYSEELSELKKENFSLKFRIYLMEERFKNQWTTDVNELNKVNIDLQVTISTLRSQLSEKNEILRKLINTAEFQDLTIKNLKDKVAELEKMSIRPDWSISNAGDGELKPQTDNQTSFRDMERKLKSTEEELKMVKDQLGSQHSNNMTELSTFIDDINVYISNMGLLLESSGNSLTPGVELLLSQLEAYCEHFKKNLTTVRPHTGRDSIRESHTACEKEVLKQLLNNHSVLKRKVEEAEKELKEKDNVIMNLKSALSHTSESSPLSAVDKSIQFSMRPSYDNSAQHLVSFSDHDKFLKEKENEISSLKEKLGKACKSIQALLKENGETAEKVKCLDEELNKRNKAIAKLKGALHAGSSRSSEKELCAEDENDMAAVGVDIDGQDEEIKKLQLDLQTALMRITELETVQSNEAQQAPAAPLMNVPDILSTSSIVLSQSALNADQSVDLVGDHQHFPASSTFKESLAGVTPLKFPSYKSKPRNCGWPCALLRHRVCKCGEYVNQCYDGDLPVLNIGLMCVPVGYKASYEMLRIRLEELSDFLQLLLDMEVNGVINLSQVSVERLEEAHRSLQDSKDLSMSLRLHESILEVTSSNESMSVDLGLPWSVVGQLCPVCGLIQLYKMGGQSEGNVSRSMVKIPEDNNKFIPLDLTQHPEDIAPRQVTGDPEKTSSVARGSGQKAVMEQVNEETPRKFCETPDAKGKMLEEMVETIRGSLSPRSPLLNKMASLDASAFPKVVNILKTEIIKAMLDKSANYPVPNTISITDVKGLQQMCEELRQRLIDAEQRLQCSKLLQIELEEKIADLESTAEGLRQQNVQLNDGKVELLAEVDALKGELVAAKLNNVELNEKIQEVTEKLSAVTDLRQSDRITLEARLCKMKNEVMNLRTCTSDTRTAICGMESIVDSFKEEIIAELKSGGSLDERMQNLLAELKSAHENIRQLEEKAVAPRCNLADHQDIVETMEAVDEKLKQTKSKYQKALEKLKEKQDYCLKSDQCVAALEAEKEQLLSCHATFQAELEDLKLKYESQETDWLDQKEHYDAQLDTLKTEKEKLVRKLSTIVQVLKENQVFLFGEKPVPVEDRGSEKSAVGENSRDKSLINLNSLSCLHIVEDESGLKQVDSGDGLCYEVEQASDAMTPKMVTSTCDTYRCVPISEEGIQGMDDLAYPGCESKSPSLVALGDEADSPVDVEELLCQVDLDILKLNSDKQSHQVIISTLQKEVKELKSQVEIKSRAQQDLKTEYCKLQSQMNEVVNNYEKKMRALHLDVEHEFADVEKKDISEKEEDVDKIFELKEKIKAAITKKASSPLKPLRDISSEYNSSVELQSVESSSFEYVPMKRTLHHGTEDKENAEYFLEHALQQSYLGHSLQSNTPGAQSKSCPEWQYVESGSQHNEHSCNSDDLNLVRENAMLREKVLQLTTELNSLKKDFENATDQILSVKNKEKNIENAIFKQLTKTRVVLKQAKTNLEKGRHLKHK